MTDQRFSPGSASLRQELADQVGYYFGALISGNNQPHMSGDPRARLHGAQRRRFDETCLEVVDTIIAALRASQPATPTGGELFDHDMSDGGKALAEKLARSSAGIEDAAATLKHYAEQYCEGWCKDSPPSASFDDCGGCRARLALAQGGDAAQRAPEPARLSQGTIDNILSKLDQGAAHQGYPEGFGFSWTQLARDAATVIRRLGGSSITSTDRGGK